MTMTTHDWIKSTLGHGETMCKHCRITNREAAVLGLLNECDKAPSIPVPAETGTVVDVLPPVDASGFYVQRYGRGKRMSPERVAKAKDLMAQSVAVIVDYAGSKTARLNPAQPDKLCEDEGCPQHGTPHVCVDPSLVEQLARRLETFADDNDAMASRRRLTITDAREMKSAAHTFRSSAKELRDAMTAQNKALYQVEINTILERFGVSETVKDEISLAIVKEFMG